MKCYKANNKNMLTKLLITRLTNSSYLRRCTHSPNRELSLYYELSIKTNMWASITLVNIKKKQHISILSLISKWRYVLFDGYTSFIFYLTIYTSLYILLNWFASDGQAWILVGRYFFVAAFLAKIISDFNWMN